MVVAKLTIKGVAFEGHGRTRNKALENLELGWERECGRDAALNKHHISENAEHIVYISDEDVLAKYRVPGE
jgi:hypothetical protein